MTGSNSSAGDESLPMLRVHQDISRQPSVKEEPEEEETTSNTASGNKSSSDPISTTSNSDVKAGVDGAGDDKIPPRHVKVALNQTETKVSIEELNRHSIGRLTHISYAN